jgi:hypothetical protein
LFGIKMGRLLPILDLSPIPLKPLSGLCRSLDQRKVIGYVDGEPQALGTLASALKGWVANTMHRQIDARLPELAWVRSAFLQAGYILYYDEPFLIFELVLSGEFAKHAYQGC